MLPRTFSLLALTFLAATFSSAQTTQKSSLPNLTDPLPVSPKVKTKGLERMLQYFDDLYYPFGIPTAEDNVELWDNLEGMPAEPETHDRSGEPSDWEYVSHFGAEMGFGSKATGRIVDIEYHSSQSDGGLFILSASGGLWRMWPTPHCISNKVSSEWGGAFCLKASDPKTIFLGTGEPVISNGTGLWKTVNGGISWSKVTMTPQPNSFYEIGYHPTNANIMFAATDQGFYRSTNGGTTWSRRFTGNVTDFVINPATPTKLFLAAAGDKFYKSTDTGNSWTGMTTGGAPTVDVSRTEMTICNADPNVMYALVSKPDGTQLGIFKTTNGGANWIMCNTGDDILRGQGWYDICIEVSPTDCNLVIAGGVHLHRGTDGFNIDLEEADHHADQHTILFKNGVIHLGNDGGYYYSYDNGVTWLADQNTLPVSQFYHLSVGKTDPLRMGGGTQDNGMIYTKGPAHTWQSLSGDGGGFHVDVNDGNVMYATNGIYGSPLPASSNFVTLDGGLNWSFANDNMPPGGEWFPVMRGDYAPYAWQYTERDGKVWYTGNQGTNWIDMSPAGNFPVDVLEMTVGQTAFPNVYACLLPPNNQLWVRDAITGTWLNRSAGLPTTGVSGTYVRKVHPSLNPSQRDVAYAIMGGTPSGAAKKVYKSINRGATWVNITGNLPNIPCTDLVAHPTDPNILILGTAKGMYRTDDGGENWYHWWEGMPRSIQITEMDWVDSTAINGHLWLYASTFGRGIWKREMGASFFGKSENGDRAEETNPEPMPKFRLDQNLAFAGDRSQTAIPYYVDVAAAVRLSLFNESGQLVRVLADKTAEPGLHHAVLDTEGLPAGVYFYSLEAPGFLASKKLVVAR